MYHHSLTPGFCQRAAIEKDVSRFPVACRQPFVVVIGVSLVENRAKGMDESRKTIIWVTIGDRDSFLTVELAPHLAPRLQDVIVQGMVIHITDFRIFEEYFIWYRAICGFEPKGPLQGRFRQLVGAGMPAPDPEEETLDEVLNSMTIAAPLLDSFDEMMAALPKA